MVEGFEVLRKVENSRCDSEDRPLDDVRISDSGVSSQSAPIGDLAKHAAEGLSVGPELHDLTNGGRGCHDR